MAENTPPKKPKRSRKNYQRQLENVLQFCKVNIDVLQSLNLDGEFPKGQIAAFNAVLQHAEK